VVAAGFESLASLDAIGETVAASILRALEPEPVVEAKTFVNRFPDRPRSRTMSRRDNRSVASSNRSVVR
jgi:hypothetical protein